MDTITTKFRLFFRSTLLLIVIVFGSLLTPLIQRGTMPTSGLSSNITRFFHKALTFILGVKIKITGTPRACTTLFVSNHVSWLDILIIGQIVPVHFLSMIEVKSWPVAGWLASRAGTLYISRGGTKAAATATEDISRLLKQQHNVVIFAEGRVTDGNIKKFHSRLLQGAIDATSDVQAIAIRYPHENGAILNPAVLFTGNISPLKSLINVMKTKQLNVDITFFEPISSEQKTRTQLAAKTENQVREFLGQPLDRQLKKTG